MFNEEKRSIGRPKLADTNQKKKSLIISGIMLLIVIILLVGGLVSLNILPKFIKLKGEAYKTYEVGEKFCLDTECFYVIEDNGDNVTALAQYNLFFGNYYDENNNYVQIPNTMEEYGLQRPDNPHNTEATLVFYNNSNGYWSDSNNNLKPSYGTQYPAYVYDENSNLYQYLQEYQDYIVNNLGYESVKTTLLSLDMAQRLTEEKWFYNADFWLGTAYSESKIYYTNSYSKELQAWNMNDGDKYGLRPVITISKDDMKNIEKMYNEGEEFCIDTECFYTISDDRSTVTALAKYNLLVGNKLTLSDINFDENTTFEIEEIDPTTKGYGLQSSEAIAWNMDSQVWIGTTEFSSESYWTDSNNNLLSKYEGTSYQAYVYDENSSIYQYVQNYQTYLRNTLGKASVSATLMSYDQAADLECTYDSDGCSYAPDFVKSTSYWLGTANYDYIYGIIEPFSALGSLYSYEPVLGIRPVITISKSDLKEKEEPATEEPPTVTNVEELTSKTQNVPLPNIASGKKVTTKKNNKVINKSATTIKSEEKTTNAIINKIVGNKNSTTTKKEEIKENKNNTKWYYPIIGVVGITIIGGIGYFAYKKKY